MSVWWLLFAVWAVALLVGWWMCQNANDEEAER